MAPLPLQLKILDDTRCANLAYSSTQQRPIAPELVRTHS